MYHAIKGEAVDKGKDFVILDNSGIEYKMFCSLQTKNEVKKPGQYIKLYTVVIHNEKEMSLYGFFSTGERDMFTALTNVPGLGNKTALLVLSQFTVEVLRNIIDCRKTYELMKIKGIGEKFAVKIIMKIKI